ncbi:CerR family C-terminal domain-containing protein [Burkholderia sp. Ac-20379]|uniref:CerR family C-terminal domain-containing protein n=1 Tax=Burkholderia sp. Ac-20379 TaxID=2703900 RepID=UPI0019809216|nr:CerR family C-terminal domain-containing protein [Burkholderia sp. Ac-20379]MBN3726144.1 CerR family C-terminal domain-containing protein [Burkholderia sp. Ac-20379]
MTEAKKLRRTSASGYARGDETRGRIIEAAIELFGERGFAGASTRDIAARAGVNAPALQYYFENKEGVLRACIEAIGDHASESFGPAIEHARAMLAEDADVDTLIDAYIGIMQVISSKMFDTPKTVHQRMFFAREQAGLEPAFASEMLMERVRRPVNTICAELVGRISGADPKQPLTQLRAFSLLGQLTVFHMAPRSALSLLGWDAFTGENGALLKSTVYSQTRQLLRMWHAENAAARPAPKSASKRVAKPAASPAQSPKPAAAARPVAGKRSRTAAAGKASSR